MRFKYFIILLLLFFGQVFHIPRKPRKSDIWVERYKAGQLTNEKTNDSIVELPDSIYQDTE